jgi:hypothetical protein
MVRKKRFSPFCINYYPPRDPFEPDQTIPASDWQTQRVLHGRPLNAARQHN